MEEYMNSALERFFNKIEFTQKEAFKDVSVEKVVVNNKKQTWTVYLKTNTPISDIKALYDLINLAHEGLEEVFDISVLINCDTVSEDDITNYFKFYLEILTKENPSLISLLDTKITVNDHDISLKVTSQIEKDLLDFHSKSILKFMTNAGLKDYRISPIIDDEERTKVKEEIKQKREDIIVKEEPKFKVIVGEPIKSKTITQIKDIFGEENNITVEAYIFGIEEFVSNKSNFRILTLKISDKTDSILAKIFSRD